MEAAAKENTASSTKDRFYNHGKLKLDASVANQYITYPTDMKLLNMAREETERLVDILYKKGKPRTYRRKQGKNILYYQKSGRKVKRSFVWLLANSCGM